jgi:hypothetical protein
MKSVRGIYNERFFNATKLKSNISMEMMDAVMNFYIGETVKVRCNMAYRRSNSSLFLLAKKIELVSIVNLVTS